MSGYPFAGKSYTVDKIIESVDTDILSINPKDFRVEDYDGLRDEEKRDVDLACWKASLDLLGEQIAGNHDSEVIIYDTACSSYDKMKQYFEYAKENNHTVVFCFVQANLKICEERAGENWLPKKVVDVYIDRFKNCIKDFADLADKTIIIKNNSNEVPDVSKITKLLVTHSNGND